jgi:hypothetical protein
MPSPISAVTSGMTSTSITTNAPPVPKPAEYLVVDLVLTFFKEKVKDLAKAGSYLAFWTTEAIPDLPPNVTKFNFMLRDFKNFVSATEVPEKLHTLAGSVTTLASDLTLGTCEKVGTTFRKVFKDTMGLINSTADSIEFAKLFIPISQETLRWVSGINFAATIGFSGNGAVEQIQNINGMNNIDPKRTTFYLINLARDVSYIALGVIGLSFIVTATPMVPWMIVACLTSGLTFSIGSYFYERIVDPENKGKNLNPAVVVENYINQRNYERRLASTTV